MAFNNLESSIEDGRPIYLYRFNLNDKVWYYTSADGDVLRNSVIWVAVPIGDDGVKQTGNATTDALKVVTTTKIVPSQIYMQYTPSRNMTLSIFETHEGDNEVVCIYIGEISSGNVLQPGTMEFTCETLSASMDRAGLRFTWQRGCNYVLYDPLTCTVDKTLWDVAGTVASVVDNVVNLPALASFPVNRFRGGFLEWVDAVRGIERRTIESQVGAVLTMFGTADGITDGLAVTAYPGCPRNTDGCASYNNLPNYGGVPAMQGKSPFDGNPVFY